MFLCFCQDVTPYMNPCPYMVYPWTPVPLVFNLFRTMGLRHLIVINTKGQVCRNHLFAWANSIVHVLIVSPWPSFHGWGEPNCLNVKKLVWPGGLPYHLKRVTLLAGPTFCKSCLKTWLAQGSLVRWVSLLPVRGNFSPYKRDQKDKLALFCLFQLVGMITRYNLTHEYMEHCLENLTSE